jgi:hypothetical protein
MKDIKTINKLHNIIEDYNKNSLSSAELIDELNMLREMVKENDQDPLVVKAIRLTYEYIEMNGEFNIQFLEERNEEDIDDFIYLLNLLEHAENEYNREELREVCNVLKEMLV